MSNLTVFICYYILCPFFISKLTSYFFLFLISFLQIHPSTYVMSLSVKLFISAVFFFLFLSIHHLIFLSLLVRICSSVCPDVFVSCCYKEANYSPFIHVFSLFYISHLVLACLDLCLSMCSLRVVTRRQIILLLFLFFLFFYINLVTLSFLDLCPAALVCSLRVRTKRQQQVIRDELCSFYFCVPLTSMLSFCCPV